jgi:hypothetical protein
MENREALETVMNAVLATKTTGHWVGVLDAAGVPCGPVYNYAQMFADPQVRHHGLVQYASDAELGEVPHIHTPIRIGDSVQVRTVVPKLGQHNAEIFDRLGVKETRMRELRPGRFVSPAVSNFALAVRSVPAARPRVPITSWCRPPGKEPDKPRVSFSLDAKPFCSDHWFYTRQLVASVASYGGDYQYTYHPPYVPEWNEFFARRVHFHYAKPRVEPERIGIIIDTADHDSFLYGLPVSSLVEPLFASIGLRSKLSSGGLGHPAANFASRRRRWSAGV